MTIRTHCRRIARRWPLVLGAVVLTAVGVGALASTRPARYEATSEVLLPAMDESALIGQARLVGTSSELAAITAENVAGVSEADVAEAVSVRRSGTALTIVATGPNPALVRDVADAHAASFMALDGPGAVDGVELIRRAAVPSSPLAPRPVRDGLLAGALAVIPSLGVAAWIGARGDRIRRGADVRSASRVLAELPLDETVDARGRGLSAAESPGIDYVAAVESLLDALGPNPLGRARRVLIAGSDAGVGASEIAANLAWVAARSGWRTVLVGGDARGRCLPQIVGPYLVEVPASQRRAGALDGLVSLPGAEGREHLAVAVAGDHVIGNLVPTKAPNLCVLPSLPGAGDRDPAAMLRSDVVGAVLDHLDGIADLVIIDAPSVEQSDGAFALAERCDDVVVVAAAGVTSRHRLTRTISRFDQKRRCVRGVVVNRVRCDGHRRRAPRRGSRQGHVDVDGEVTVIPAALVSAGSRSTTESARQP